MNKLISLFLIIVSLQLTQCSSSSKITYAPSNMEFVVDTFKYYAGQQPFAIPQVLSCFTVGGGYLSQFKNDPIDVNYLFHEYPEKAKKLISVSAAVFKADPNNKFTIPLTKIKAEAKMEYYNGTSLEKKNPDPLNLLKSFPDTIPGYSLPKFIALDFTFSDKFKMEDYPQELKIVFTIKWTDAEKKFEYTLTKEQYQSRKLNLKY